MKSLVVSLIIFVSFSLISHAYGQTTVENNIGTINIEKNEIFVNPYSDEQIKIYGKVLEPTRGSKITINITDPEGEVSGLQIFSTDDGYYETPQVLNWKSPRGIYTVFVTYGPKMIGTIFYTVSEAKITMMPERPTMPEIPTIKPNLILTLQQNANSFKIYPAYTDDDGNKLSGNDGNNEFIQIYIDDQLNKSIRANEWSDDILLSDGNHSIYATSSELLVENTKYLLSTSDIQMMYVGELNSNTSPSESEVKKNSSLPNDSNTISISTIKPNLILTLKQSAENSFQIYPAYTDDNGNELSRNDGNLYPITIYIDDQLQNRSIRANTWSDFFVVNSGEHTVMGVTSKFSDSITGRIYDSVTDTRNILISFPPITSHDIPSTITSDNIPSTITSDNIPPESNYNLDGVYASLIILVFLSIIIIIEIKYRKWKKIKSMNLQPMPTPIPRPYVSPNQTPIPRPYVSPNPPHKKPTSTNQNIWPKTSDYVEEIQNPKICFTDKDLQSSKVIFTRDGSRPFFHSGNFATVFKLELGNKMTAVKCFTSKTKNFSSFTKIIDHLKKCNLDFLITYDDKKTIMVKGKPYSILISDWIDGENLDDYILKNANNKILIKKIAEDFKRICVILEKNLIAHGDLQHGNILVTKNNQIKLVDYDGLYVPALSGNVSNEIGLPDYQSPYRNFQFDETLDRFSSVCIYLSLLCIAENSSFFNRYNTGNNLIFKKSDFEEPQRSQLFKEISTLKNMEINQILKKFTNMCKEKNLEKLQKFEQIIILNI